ncbi:glycoside hydrolase family 18 protein [Colletotrichum scovillei]|uniref:chitinase n=1 Tax=Colletotrichum scovillei TaxID=1209932 RepID=A0A9P7R400_9PEZI|nr:glycoside hydrolase family 18 protein [Colletotrichum scovillei]KAG7068837.1 glycoside hydrolase family 18 protein [Colletotrichum scovillei]KAG7072793.1 glycoside hydrolase family 18 protein [Colletotrichum scovillei]
MRHFNPKSLTLKVHAIARMKLLKPAVLVFCLLLAASGVIAQQDYSCSPTKPCKLGCCGKNNVCGLGPSYCAPANCTSSCGAKSECDPGWGSAWSQREKCPLNVCCSKFGFCGTTKEFCGDKKVKAPSCPGGSSAGKRVIGYYEGWSTTKACNGLNPEDLLYTAYTHLNYAFAFIDPTSYKIANMQDSDSKFMPRLTALKNYNPGMEVWIAIGGWSMNDPDQPTKRTFSELAASKAKQDAFFSSLLSFMNKYGFDGVDIDWEYPVAEERSGTPEDYKNLVTFLKNLRAALGTKGLTITLPASYWYLQHFDLKNIQPYLDWFNMMSYDLHGTWDGTNPYLGPYVNSHTNLTEIDRALELLWRNDVDPKKVVMGMGFYGRSFTLSNPSCKTAGCGFSAGGAPGRCSASAGTLMFSEIQEIIDKGGAQVTTDKTAAVKIVTWGGNQWVSYDDEETLKLKMDYANGKCLGGVMVWAASTDDAKGTAIKALAKASGRTDLSKSLFAKAVSSDHSQCVWGECGASCPSGLVPVESSGSNASPLGIELGCNQGKRNFCCPSKNPPTCKWKGSPKFCGALAKNRCSGKEIEIAASTDGCWTGHKSLCCTKTDSTSTLDSCEWLGAAPFCSAGATFGSILGLGTTPVAGAFSFLSYGCPNKDKPKELTTGKQGEGGQQTRSGNTAWVQWKQILSGPLANLFFDFSTDCKTGCESGEVTVATDGFGCRSGTYSYFCCGNPNTPAEPKLPEISLCPSPANLPDLSTVPEGGSSPKNVFKEGDIFDNNCILPPTTKRRHMIRAARPHQKGFDSNDTSSEVTEHPALAGMDTSDLFGRSLEKRGARDVAMKLCAPGKQSSSIYTQNYPGATSIIRTTGKAFTVAKQGVCAAVGITALTNLDANTNWVTEHVFEKQEFRDAVEWMMDGNTPKGVALTAGKAPFTGVFDLNGLFQDIWPSKTYTTLKVVQDWAGNINDAFTGLLGRTSDAGLNNANIVNLQVCDADFNRYKEFIVAGSDFMSQATWKNYSPTGRIAILSDVIDTFAYRSESSVITSYQKTYASLATLWGDFGRYALSKGVSYDFASAWKQIVPANLESQVSSARTLFESYVKSELAFWKSTAAATTYSPVVVKEMTDKLTDWQGKVTTLIALPISKMTA